MAREQGVKPITQNKRARHDYEIEERYEAGLSLTGTEVKSLREGRASLAESFISIDRRGWRTPPSPNTSTARGTTTPRGAAASCCSTAARSTGSPAVWRPRAPPSCR